VRLNWIDNFDANSARHSCFFTKRKRRDNERVIRTGVSIDFMGELDICVQTAEEIASFIGWEHPSTFDDLRQEILDIKNSNISFQAAVAKLREFLDAAESDQFTELKLTLGDLPDNGRPRVSLTKGQ